MADEKQVTQPAQNPTGGGNQPEPQATPQEARFTQAELDKIISERLARERSHYADYDDLKKFREDSESKSKSEIEKLAERAAKAEQKAKEVAEQTTARLLNAEARAVAAELGFSKPDKAIRLADLSEAVKDGEVDSAKVKNALEALAKEMPELLRQPDKKSAPPVGAQNAAKSDGGQETVEQRRARIRGGANVSDWLSSGGVVINPKGQ